jgi:hypothetical protein
MKSMWLHISCLWSLLHNCLLFGLPYSKSASKGSVSRQSVEVVKNGMSGRIWKQIPMTVRGKTPGEKVEDGTGFKVESRGEAVYQGTLTGRALSCWESKWGFRKQYWKRLPETPVKGKTIRDPQEGSAHSGDQPLWVFLLYVLNLQTWQGN